MRQIYLRIILSGLFLIAGIFGAGSNYGKINAQTGSTGTPIKVRGYVYDQSEPPVPLPGVTIVHVEKGTGTITDPDGFFEIDAKEGETLRISFVGFKTHELKVSKEKNRYVVSLEEEVTKLKEVVVVGETQMQKQHTTASITRVDVMEQIQGKPVTNISQSLQGGVTGIVVNQGSGKPGSDDASIKIRGAFSFGQNKPLILVDGIPIDNIDDVNPDMISSMTVLKDAAASAIYGVRGAGGVIIIETKRGMPGQMQATYSTYTGIQRPTKLPEFVDAPTYMRMYNEASINDGGNALYSDYDIARTEEGIYRISYPNTDWVDETIDMSSLITSHAINVTGGNNLARIALSGRYLFHDAMIDRVNAHKFNIRVNTTVTMAKNLVMYLDAAVSRNLKNEVSNYSSILSSMYQAPPTMHAKYPMKPDSDIHYYGIYSGDGAYNPLMYTEQGGDVRKWLDKSLTNLKIKYTITEGLKLTSQFGFNIISSHGQEFRKPFAVYSYETEELLKEWDYEFSTNVDKKFSTRGKVNLNYDKKFGKNKVYGLLGSYVENDATSEKDQIRVASFYGKVNYSFNNKYLVELTGRFDGSSLFESGNKWGFFPSVALGWNIHNESFMDNQQFITYLKLRGSHGQVGNSNISPYKYQFSINPKNGLEEVIGNDNIKWEVVTMTNVGIDIGFFQNQNLELNLDAYQKITTDMILRTPFSQVSGIEPKLRPESNVGELKNQGFEVSLNINQPLSETVRFTSRLGFAYNAIEITKLENGPYIWSNKIKEEGGSINDYYGYKTDGLLTQEDIDNGYPIFNNQKAGDIKYVDIKPDGVLNEEDQTNLGRSWASMNFFGNFGLKIKRLDFNVQLTGIAGKKARLGSRVAYPFYNGGKPQTVHVGSYWTPENPNADYPRLSLLSEENDRPSDYFMVPAWYVRLRTVQVGYTFDKEKIWKLKGLRVYANVQNPLVWSKIETLDPESLGGQSTYPIMSTYSLGLKANF